MTNLEIKRRDFLRHLCSLGVIGAANSLYSFPVQSSAAHQSSLKHQIGGRVIDRLDENYEIWRQSMVWHISKPNRYPDWIIQAQSEEDVIKAINYSRLNGLKIATRSSGHNSTGAALRDNGILLDLSGLRGIDIDATNQTASVGPGLMSQQMLNSTLEEGLAFPAAHCPSVAMGGYLLGGGLGWNHAHWGGIACHSILGADIILANGNKVRANPSSYRDLLWAIKGAGPGFFGAVTRYKLKLYPAPKSILANMYIHPLDNLTTVTDALDQLVQIKDKRVELLVLLMHNPQLPEGSSPEQSKICMVGINAFADSEAEAKSLLAPFTQSQLATTSVFKMENQITNFNKLYNPEGVDTGSGRYAVDNIWTNEPAKALHVLAKHFEITPSPRSHVVASYAIDPTLHKDAAFSCIANNYIASYMVWNDKKYDEANHTWLKKANELVEPYSNGHYVNEVAADHYPERIQNSFSEANWERLKTLRKRYDPQRLFHTYLGFS